MFSKIWTFGPFFAKVTATVEHDVEAIITTFTSTVDKLEAAAVAKTAEAFSLAQRAEELTADSAVAKAAADKATAVASKIKALVA
jgi:uncharacterized protein YkwD